jgi:hypothetical protein
MRSTLSAAAGNPLKLVRSGEQQARRKAQRSI